MRSCIPPAALSYADVPAQRSTKHWKHLGTDLVLHSANGFDMKGKFNHPALSQMGGLTGMHIFKDAIVTSAAARAAVAAAKNDLAEFCCTCSGVPLRATLTENAFD
jgi:hypothetical protein